MSELRDLLMRWSRLEPERCKPSEVGDFGISDISERRGYIIYLDDPEMFDQVNDIQALVQKAITAKPGWGWTKPYMLRNDVQVMTDYDMPRQSLFRCAGFATAHCDTSLVVNLLETYLQALEVL